MSNLVHVWEFCGGTPNVSLPINQFRCFFVQSFDLSGKCVTGKKKNQKDVTKFKWNSLNLTNETKIKELNVRTKVYFSQILIIDFWSINIIQYTSLL